MTLSNRPHRVLEPYAKDVAFERATAEYISQFEYRVTVRLGPSYSKEFKEFSEWCSDRLGVRYKDWFIIASAKNEYVLHCRTDKWSTFLALTHIDKIV
jgi:hypothetical protein